MRADGSEQRKHTGILFSCEWMIEENGQSGVFLRVAEGGINPSFDAIEIQICDDQGSKHKNKNSREKSGAIYGVTAVRKPTIFKGAGKWNSFEITCKETRVKLKFNGESVWNIDLKNFRDVFPWWGEIRTGLYRRPREGYIGLQAHGSKVYFRNIEVKIIKTPVHDLILKWRAFLKKFS